MKIKEIILGVFLAVSIAFSLNLTDLREIQGVNPTPYELNSYILKKCKENDIPPIILKAILLQEGQTNHKWQQYSSDSQYNHETIVYGRDSASYGLGLFQITYKIDSNKNFLTEYNFNDIEKVVSDWKFNVDIAILKLLIKWKANVGSMTGIDSNSLIIENWYYPIAWYNGSGHDAKLYVDKIYSFMRKSNSVANYLKGSSNYNKIITYYTTVSDISDPYRISSFRGDNIQGLHPQVYTLEQILDSGGKLHIWDKQSNSYKSYTNNTNSNQGNSTISSTNLPIIDGAGSLIRTALLGTGTADEKKCQWGCYRDEADMQSHTRPSTVSFQWKATNSCKKLKIGVLASEEYRKKYNTWINPHSPLKVKIYTKAWDSPVVSKAFETTLPKTVEYVDGWNNIIITSKEPLDKKTEIIAECTKSDDGKEVTMLDEETSIDLPLDYKFGGQSSIIRDSNKNYNEQEDGIYQDVAIGLSNNKAMTLFQWQTSSNCSSLILKSGHYPNNNGISATVNGVSIKGWADKDWKDNKCNKKLPCTLRNPSIDGKSHFYIIKVKTNVNTLDGNRISAVCIH